MAKTAELKIKYFDYLLNKWTTPLLLMKEGLSFELFYDSKLFFIDQD